MVKRGSKSVSHKKIENDIKKLAAKIQKHGEKMLIGMTRAYAAAGKLNSKTKAKILKLNKEFHSG